MPVDGAAGAGASGWPCTRHSCPRLGWPGLSASSGQLPGIDPRQVLLLEPEIKRISEKISSARNVIYLGRGSSYPLALEGALKLKEISYIHAEGFAAGELKHGPIALIDETVPVVVIAPSDAVLEKTVSNVQEVAARGGRDRGDR